MKTLQIRKNPEVDQIFENYPDAAKHKMESLRRLVLEVAEEIPELAEMEETLKWGEPAYLTKHGSTIRIDWKVRNPDQYAMYFQCTSQLVPTFRTVYGDDLTYEGNRAIIFGMEEVLPEKEVKNCVKAALMYHKVKKLPFLGMA